MDEYITLKEASRRTGKAVKTLRKIVPKLDSKKELVKNSPTVFISTDSLMKFYGLDPTQRDTHGDTAPLLVKNESGVTPPLPTRDTQEDTLMQSLKDQLKRQEDEINRLWDQIKQQESRHSEALRSKDAQLSELIKSTNEQIQALIRSKEHSDIMLRESHKQLKLESQQQKKSRSRKIIEFLFYK